MIEASKFRKLLEILHIINMKMSEEAFNKIINVLVEEINRFEVKKEV